MALHTPEIVLALRMIRGIGEIVEPQLQVRELDQEQLQTPLCLTQPYPPATGSYTNIKRHLQSAGQHAVSATSCFGKPSFRSRSRTTLGKLPGPIRDFESLQPRKTHTQHIIIQLVVGHLLHTNVTHLVAFPRDLATHFISVLADLSQKQSA